MNVFPPLITFSILRFPHETFVSKLHCLARERETDKTAPRGTHKLIFQALPGGDVLFCQSLMLFQNLYYLPVSVGNNLCLSEACWNYDLDTLFSPPFCKQG